MRVLVIEDEVKIAQALARALRSQGYAVDAVHDSDEGFAMASTEPYDILIIDRLLPGGIGDGVTLIRQLRAEQVATPALLLTALGSTEQKTEGLDAGADDYMTKPFAIDELLARVRALLRRPTVNQATVLRASNLTLDPTQREVHFNDDLINLTVKEFALLEYLMRNPDRPVSKEQIIAHVWDYDADVLPNTVEVYIKYLRDKIDTPYHTHFIVTVRGVGYKFNSES